MSSENTSVLFSFCAGFFMCHVILFPNDFPTWVRFSVCYVVLSTCSCLSCHLLCPVDYEFIYACNLPCRWRWCKRPSRFVFFSFVSELFFSYRLCNITHSRLSHSLKKTTHTTSCKQKYGFCFKKSSSALQWRRASKPNFLHVSLVHSRHSGSDLRVSENQGEGEPVQASTKNGIV